MFLAKFRTTHSLAVLFILAGVFLGQQYVIAQSGSPVLRLENLDGVPFANRLVFSRIGDAGPPPSGNIVHDQASVRIKNVSQTTALSITALSVSGEFTLVNPPTLPASIPPGGQLDITVQFISTCCGTNLGTLTISSNDPQQPTTSVELAGFWQPIAEGGTEPSLGSIVNLFGYSTVVVGPSQQLNKAGLIQAIGDEVLSPYWKVAVTTQPVTLRQIASYHTQGRSYNISYFPKGSTTLTKILSVPGLYSQTVLPQTTPLPASFTPSATVFGFNGGGEWSDATKNSTTYDSSSGCPGPCGHHVRFWPVYNREGALEQNTWLLAMDFSGGNYDFQDNLYLISNIRPENPPGDPNIAPLPGAAELVLDFNTTYPAGTLVDRDGEPLGFNFTQANKLDKGYPAGSNSYQAPLLNIVTSGAGTLNITSTAGSSSGNVSSADNTLVNGLLKKFDATAGKFTISTKILGPLNMISLANQQGGVVFGPDQDNFFKLIVVAKNGAPAVSFFLERNGSGGDVGGSNSYVPIPNSASLLSLELMLLGDPATGVVRAAYRALYPASDTGIVVLPNSVTLTTQQKNRFFALAAKAGLLTSHKGTTTPVTFAFDRFAVTPGDASAPPENPFALYRLDVGGTGDYIDTNGNLWTPDTGYFSPSSAIAEGASVQPLEIENTNEDQIYRTYRGNVGNVPLDQRVLTYNIPVTGEVDLRLHFAERFAPNGDFGKRLFDIEAEGRSLRDSFDIYEASGGLNTAIALPINSINVTDGYLTLVLKTEVNNVSIAGIEVFCHDASGATCSTNIPPSVSLTSPANGAAFTAPAGISVSANATDSDGTISKVDFYAGSTLIGTATSAPYTINWNNVPAGIYSLTAVATDNASGVTTSSPVSVTVNAPPAGGVTLGSAADAYVRDAGYATTNFGSVGEIDVKLNASSGNNRQGYLRFDLSGVNGGLTSVKLRLYGRLFDTNGTNVPIAAYSVSDTTWSEGGITWNNKPVSGVSPLATVTVVNTAFAWYEWDLTSYAQAERAAGRNVISVALKGPSASVPYALFNTKEAGSNQPRLVINGG